MGRAGERIWQAAILLAVAAFLILQWLVGYAFVWAFLLAVLVAAVAVLAMWLLRARPADAPAVPAPAPSVEPAAEATPIREPEPAPPVEVPEPLPIASEEVEAADDLADLADFDDEALFDAAPEKDAPEEPSDPYASDNLRAIKGIGPKIEAALHAAGITTFAQIAGWSADDIAHIESRLRFAGRIGRDDWVAQARTLDGNGRGHA